MKHIQELWSENYLIQKNLICPNKSFLVKKAKDHAFPWDSVWSLIHFFRLISSTTAFHLRLAFCGWNMWCALIKKLYLHVSFKNRCRYAETGLVPHSSPKCVTASLKPETGSLLRDFQTCNNSQQTITHNLQKKIKRRTSKKFLI